jgi:ribonuclease HI
MKQKSKKKFYAVACGEVPGVYCEWDGENGARAQVKGFPGAIYRGFQTEREARAWLEEFQRTGTAPKASETDAPKFEKELSDHGIDVQQQLQEGNVVMYTDGGCIDNPGPGGYGVVLLSGNKHKELSAGYRLTTNNRMELLACIEGLSALKRPCTALLFSDSRYVVDGIEKGWARRWKRKGWMRTATQPAENPDLWNRLLELCDIHNVSFFWVKGHAGFEENERCDQLANQASTDSENHLHDTVYENLRKSGASGSQKRLFE